MVVKRRPSFPTRSSTHRAKFAITTLHDTSHGVVPISVPSFKTTRVRDLAMHNLLY